MNKEIWSLKVVSVCSAAILVAALAELKFFYIEFVVILAVTSLITSFSFKKLFIIIGAVFGLNAGVYLLGKIFPYYADFFTINGILANITDSRGYSGANDINRFTGFSIINNRFLTNSFSRLFGLGLGNCDYSTSFSFLMSPFFKMNELLHYTWLSIFWVYLECGILGLFMFIGFFVLISIHSLSKMKRTTSFQKTYYQYSVLLGIICCMCFIYNSSLRTEAAYLIYIAMALPFCGMSNEGKGLVE